LRVAPVATIVVSKSSDNLFGTLAATLDKLDGFSLSPNDSVLIKPNLVEPAPYTSGQTTSPYLVEAVVRWCHDRGVKEVVIGEGPTYYQPAALLKDCFTETGVDKIARKWGVTWLLFDEHPFKTFPGNASCLPESFGISTLAFGFDKIINLPVPKTHYLTGVSIALKNLKGFLKREDKPRFHQRNIHKAVVELNKLIRPSLHIVDGTASRGDSKPFVLAGCDPVAVDAVTTSLMGLKPRRIKTISFGHEAGLGEMDFTRMRIEGDDLKAFQMSLELPQEELKNRFSLLSLVGAEDACCGCIFALFSCLAQLESHGKKMKAPLTVALGETAEVTKGMPCLSLGDCTGKMKGSTLHIGGCPPSREEILARIEKIFA
jgi:uncharacterized protein (DUF362 family)